LFNGEIDFFFFFFRSDERSNSSDPSVLSMNSDKSMKIANHLLKNENSLYDQR